MVDNTTAAVWDKDNRLTPNGQPGWRRSSLLRIKDCANLTLAMDRGDSDLATILHGAVFVVENIDSLHMKSFDAANRGTYVKTDRNLTNAMNTTVSPRESVGNQVLSC